MVFALSYILAMLVGPETEGTQLVAELSIS
jgi:hypothetical protein